MVVEHIHDSPKLNVFCAVSFSKISLQKKLLTGTVYLDMLTEWLLPQLQEDGEDFILQENGAPPHFHWIVRDHLNAELADHWIVVLLEMTPLFFHGISSYLT